VAILGVAFLIGILLYLSSSSENPPESPPAVDE
jgi:hypothetical protein